MGTLAILALAYSVSQSLPVEYADIREAAGFPGDPTLLKEYTEEQMRSHVWNIFSLLTERSKSGMPVWMTWYGKQEVFSEQKLGDFRSGAFAFDTISQFVHLDQKSIERSLPSRVLFNRFAAEHIQENRLTSPSHRNNLLQALAGVTGRGRTLKEALSRTGSKIADFDSRSVVLKAVWWPIRQEGYTALPVWDGVGYGALETYAVDDWPRVLAVSPYTGDIACGQTRAVTLKDRVQMAPVVSISRFYSIRIAADADAAHINRSDFATLMQDALGRPAEVGDHAVLVALHMITKELPDWIWATFWWHDRPDEGLYADERPVSLGEPWRNYLMNQIVKNASEESHRINYNPWLEAPMQNGVRSNCIACHERAGWDRDAPQYAPFPGMATQQFQNHFHDSLQTGFLWTVANLQPRTKAPPPE